MGRAGPALKAETEQKGRASASKRELFLPACFPTGTSVSLPAFGLELKYRLSWVSSLLSRLWDISTFVTMSQFLTTNLFICISRYIHLISSVSLENPNTLHLSLKNQLVSIKIYCTPGG